MLRRTIEKRDWPNLTFHVSHCWVNCWVHNLQHAFSFGIFFLLSLGGYFAFQLSYVYCWSGRCFYRTRSEITWLTRALSLEAPPPDSSQSERLSHILDIWWLILAPLNGNRMIAAKYLTSTAISLSRYQELAGTYNKKTNNRGLRVLSDFLIFHFYNVCVCSTNRGLNLGVFYVDPVWENFLIIDENFNCTWPTFKCKGTEVLHHQNAMCYFMHAFIF